jgi:hypothetical protein
LQPVQSLSFCFFAGYPQNCSTLGVLVAYPFCPIADIGIDKTIFLLPFLLGSFPDSLDFQPCGG